MKQPSLFHTLITTVSKRNLPPIQSTILSQRPQVNNLEARLAYWQMQNQLWRTQAEVYQERQKYLDELCAISS